MENEVVKFDKAEEQLWDRAQAELHSIADEPYPKLTTALRIVSMVVTVGVLHGLVLSDTVTIGAKEGNFPTVYYRVVSDPGLQWDGLSPACDVVRTPGGDCNALVRQYAGFVTYAVAPHKLDSKIRLISTMSAILPSLPIDLISGLTLGAVSGTPTLGVVFTPTDDQQMIAWKARHDFIEILGAALASRILVDAGFRPRVYVDFFDEKTWCVANYLGGSVGKKRLGLPGKCVLSACNWSSFNSQSKNNTCFGTDCENAALQHLGWNSGLGFGPCIGGYDESPWFSGAIAFLIYSLCIAVVATVLSLMLLNSALDMYSKTASQQLPATWPAFHRLAAKQQRPIGSIVEEHASIIMYLECSTMGNSAKVARSFTHLLEGVQGVVTHMCFIIITGLPLHLFLYFSIDGYDAGIVLYRTMPRVILVTHYSVQLLYTIGYYLRMLPFHWRRGLLIWLYNKFTMLILCISLLLLFTQLLWMLSAIYYNQAYVLSVFTYLGSLAGFQIQVAYTVKRYSKMVQKKAGEMQAHIHQSFADMEKDASIVDKDVKMVRNFGEQVQGVAQRKVENASGAISTLPGLIADSDTKKVAWEAQQIAEGSVNDTSIRDNTELKGLMHVAERGTEVLDITERDGEKMMKVLVALNINGKKLYATLALAGVLIILSAVFIFQSAEQWRGGDTRGYSLTNLLTPLIVLVSTMKSRGLLQKGDKRIEGHA